jgi:SAM-dependent methyltransferase
MLDVDHVIETVSANEGMPADDLAGYLATGRSALEVIQLAQASARVADFASILDMPSGHGRVLRWLKAAYPQARLSACDILRDGVEYCAATFGATRVHTDGQLPAAAFPSTYDLIWVGSLLTHVDADEWDRLVDLWNELLNPGGLLVVTTHGELVAERMRAGHLYGYPQPGITRALRAYDHAGFAFLEQHPEQVDYGITLSHPRWVVDRLTRHADHRLVFASEARWANHQDVFAVMKADLDPALAERPL